MFEKETFSPGQIAQAIGYLAINDWVSRERDRGDGKSLSTRESARIRGGGGREERDVSYVASRKRVFNSFLHAAGTGCRSHTRIAL